MSEDQPELPTQPQPLDLTAEQSAKRPKALEALDCAFNRLRGKRGAIRRIQAAPEAS